MTVRARLHHSALHDRQNECGEIAGIGIHGQSPACIAQALFNRKSPFLEIRSEPFLNRRIRFVQLEGKDSNRTSVSAFGFDKV
jgi:hypothetical protein